jgi:urease accessory protein
MIKRIVQITREGKTDDSVVLSWHSLCKPYISGVSQRGVNFLVHAENYRLQDGDILVSGDGYAITLNIEQNDLYVFEFQEPLDFATTAYKIGNRHQPIQIENMKITALKDAAISDIVASLQDSNGVVVQEISGCFFPNVNKSHSH